MLVACGASVIGPVPRDGVVVVAFNSGADRFLYAGAVPEAAGLGTESERDLESRQTVSRTQTSPRSRNSQLSQSIRSSGP